MRTRTGACSEHPAVAEAKPIVLLSAPNKTTKVKQDLMTRQLVLVYAVGMTKNKPDNNFQQGATKSDIKRLEHLLQTAMNMIFERFDMTDSEIAKKADKTDLDKLADRLAEKSDITRLEAITTRIENKLDATIEDVDRLKVKWRQQFGSI